MPRDHADLVRRIYDEWGRGNFRAGTDLFAEDVILVIRPEFPDAGTYTGPKEIRAYMRGFLEDWTDAAIAAEEVVGAGERVAVAVHQRATGTGSGVSIDMRYWQVWTFRDEAVVRIESVKERAHALEVAGLRPPSG